LIITTRGHMTIQPERASTETIAPFVRYQETFNKAFPGLIQDNVLDVSRLGQLLNIDIAGTKDGKESYGLMWAGRKNASEALQTTSMAALRPDLEASVSWETAENVFIEGDNLEVLKLIEAAYNDRVKMVYIDPPYNTANDFVYNDDFSDPLKHYLEVTHQVDSSGNRLVANLEVTGRKHSNWLTMLYPRLIKARNVLSQDGVVFVSIDDTELAPLRMLMDEVFGAENYISTFNWKKRSTGGQVANNAIIDQIEYILCYARNISEVTLSGLPNENVGRQKWRGFRKAGGQWERRYRPNQYFPIYGNAQGQVSLEPFEGAEAIYPRDSQGVDGFWENGLETTTRRINNGELKSRLINGKLSIEQLEVGGETTNAGNFIDIPSVKGSQEIKELFGASVFENPKPTDLLINLMHIANLQDGSIVLDFFAGSGSTGHAVHRFAEQTGRRPSFVLVNLDEKCRETSVAFEIGFRTVSEISIARLQKVNQNLGLRVFRLAPSSFEQTKTLAVEGEFTLSENSLKIGAKDKDVAHEILLSQGYLLSDYYEEFSKGSVRGLACGTTAVIYSRTADSEFLDFLRDERYTSFIFLEDSLAGQDALKSNIFYTAKNINKVAKFF
jgi:adenine-specific DNA-methyltransferase